MNGLKIASLLRFVDLEDSNYSNFRLELIKAIEKDGIEEVLKNKEYLEFIENKQIQKQIDRKVYKEHAKLIDKVVFYDLTEATNSDILKKPRFESYYWYPESKFHVVIQKRDDVYLVTAAKNPWKKTNPNIHLGKMAKEFNGGGHVGIGVMRFEKYEDALKKAKELVEYLNKNG